MSNLQLVITVFVLGLGVWITRFLPFAVFKNAEKMPKIIDYLGTVLPAAMMGLLVVYSMKDYSLGSVKDALPPIVSSLCVVLVHLWRKNTILSISLGTVLYMVLIRVL